MQDWENYEKISVTYSQENMVTMTLEEDNVIVFLYKRSNLTFKITNTVFSQDCSTFPPLLLGK